jgi:hypothetical protein
MAPKGNTIMLEEIDTAPVDKLSLGELHAELKKIAAQIAAHEANQAELGDALKRAKDAATKAGDTYRAQRNTKHMLEAMLRADIAADAVEAVTATEHAVEALQKRHREIARIIHVKETSEGRGDFNPWMFA